MGEHPWTTAFLALLGTALGALGPWLQLKTGQERPEASLALSAVGLLPMEMYFIPRFLAFLDARSGDREANPREAWRDRFDARWLRAFGARMLLAFAAGLGFLLLVLPGLIVLLLFGWAPFRVLLRGESLREAARASLRITAAHWPRIILVGSATFSIYLGAALLLNLGLELGLPEPSLQTQLVHPAMHLGRLVTALLGLWLNLALLELYHAVEVLPEVPPADA